MKTSGRAKEKLLRIALVVEQKENGFNNAPAAARPGKNNPHDFLI